MLSKTRVRRYGMVSSWNMNGVGVGIGLDVSPSNGALLLALPTRRRDATVTMVINDTRSLIN